MARIRTVDFLPEIFKTDTNTQFLGATLDQLVQEPELKRTQGYIGRRFGPGTRYNDSYVLENTALRSSYQLEPGYVYQNLDSDTVDAITYPEIVDAVHTKGGNVVRHDRLFASETYSWDPSIDFDKFINYGQYYWLPAGPDSVNVQSSDVALTDSFNITTEDQAYQVSDISGSNPTITLVRGGSYTFNVNQDSSFWIQAEAGVDGTFNYSPNISTRNVDGVVNNGASSGTITFNVPKADAQQYFHNLDTLSSVDLATTDRFDSINAQLVSEFAGIDGITDLEGKTLVFLQDQPGDSYDLGWQRVGQFDNDIGYDKEEFEPTTYLDSQAERYSLYIIQYIRPDGSSDEGAYINLHAIQEIDNETKFIIGYGAEYSNKSFYKTVSGYFAEVPLLTAANDYLYYQDGSTANKFGIIQFVDQEGAQQLNITQDILGQTAYTSPNGVTFTNGLKVVFRGTVIPSEYADNEYYVEGVGESISLVRVDNLVTPSSYFRNVTGTDNQPEELDYITIKRDSIDLNHWSRSNRWFHADVINKTAEYNQQVAVFDNDARAKRPIIEFESNLSLYNFGKQTVDPIDVIDFTELDALSNVHGSLGYSVDGHAFANGTRVVFAADTDASVRNVVYEVTLVDPDDDSTEYGTIVNLQPVDNGEISADQNVYCRSGNTQTGKQYRYDGEEWQPCQQKTAVNQAPLFDVYDVNGYSFGDVAKYPSTTFKGSKLFSYKVGNTVAVDPVLGFSLTYENIDNIGDIVFESNWQTDSFVYVSDSTSVNVNVKSGYTRKYNTLTSYETLSGWTTSADKNWQRQVFTYQYDGSTPLYTDVTPRSNLSVPAVKVYVENKFVSPSTYSVQDTGQQAIITFNSTSEIVAGNLVQVKIISKQASSVAYYEVPSNLESNTFNEDSERFTLGTIRNHYNRLTENVEGFVGERNGSNNSRDIGHLHSYGDVIVQHASSLAPAAFFLRNQQYDFFKSVDKAARDYQNFKNQILHWVDTNDTYGQTAAALLDQALADINVGKTDSTVYYWSDMLPAGGDYVESFNEVTVISTRNYVLSRVYDFTEANTTGLLVYHNNVLLLKDTDYTVATDGARITLTFDPTVGDTIVIREYATTYGSFVPPTPTKLGLYPEKDPSIYTDYSYLEPQTVIQGHDGSITIGFNDVRDDILLEFERRVYNNLKWEGNRLPIIPADILPGEFRDTEYSLGEVNEILAAGFLDWCGWNKLDYKTQDYKADNPWTWNYSTATCTLDGSLLPGHWRGIYRKYYDTDHPHLHPWEMLGIIDEPNWWEDTYGPAPYTSGNLVMWEDLEAGYNRNADTYDERYARPGLTTIIPTDSEGNLKAPLDVLVASYNSLDFHKSWNFGDGGPVESSWRKSSSFAFAVQKLYALTKPAEYFALMADRDRNKKSTLTGQYAYDNRYRYNFQNTEVTNNELLKHSYINWIVEFQRSTGIEQSTELTNLIQGADVRLMYRVGGFTDKKYLKVFTDKSSPDSTNTSLAVPDESYQLFIHKNQTFVDLQYSSVMIQKTQGGYAVYGNSMNEAYFKILQSVNNANYKTFKMGDTQYRLPVEFTNNVVRVPYGYSFTNKNSVIDFLVSYGEYLKSQGLVFEDVENNYELNWGQMANEFAYWAEQGWSEGSLININPAANVLEFDRVRTIVDDLNNLAVNEQPLDQNRQPLTSKDYAVSRIGNQFKITGLSNRSIAYLRLNGVSYEHLLIIDNKSIFNDLMYNPVTGIRQQRVRIDGYKTANWEGQLNSPGFVLNQDNVVSWKANRAYNKGDLVKYKNSYWSAAIKIQPKEEFKFEDWIKVNYDSVSKGMLPNIANKADQMQSYYNNRVANLESDADLLGLGLTGFRKRDYLESLNLDDISQVQVYQNLVENKGTPLTTKLFQNVKFDKETSEYDIFENWAIRRATYGASSSKSFVEFELDNSLLKSNPSTLEVGQGAIVVDDQPSADQYIDVNSIYKQSVKHNSSSIFPELTETITDTTLPTAGFVSLDDVEITVFDINDLSNINDNIDLVSEAAHVWVARKNPYDWDVYRCTAIEPNEIEAIDNLNGTVTITFDSDHTLAVGQIVVIKQFSTLLNGAHRVKSLTGVNSIVIDGALTENASTITGTGIVFKLVSARVDQPSDLLNLEFANNLLAGDKIWAENTQDNKWAVYTKETPFELVESQVPTGASSNIGFGTSVAQGHNAAGLIIGAPLNNTNGSLFCYNKDNKSYRYAATIDSVSGVTGYGSSLDFAQNWAIAGAPASQSSDGAAVIIKRNPAQNLFSEHQALVLPSADQASAGEYGHAVTMSEDENWVYVSAPEISKVYAYQLVSYQEQSARFVSDGNTATYSLDNLIVVDNKNQLLVTVDGNVLTSSQYNLTANNLTINDVPTSGVVITAERKKQVTSTGDGSTTSFAGASQLYSAESIEAFAVYVDGELMLPYYDYTFSGSNIVFATAPAADAPITIRATDYYKHVDTITGSANTGFGRSIKTTTDGQQIYIGAELTDVGALTDAGQVYMYERLVERHVVESSAFKTYNLRREVDNQLVNVFINGELQSNSFTSVGNETYQIDEVLQPDSSVKYQSVTLSDSTELTVGDVIDVDINQFNLVQTVTLDNNNQGAKFGSSIAVCRTDCSVYVGAPEDNWSAPSAGSVTRFVNSSRAFGTITGTVSSPTLTPGNTIRIDNIDVAVTGSTLNEFVDDINNAIVPNVQASVVDNKIVISVVNLTEAASMRKMTVMPGDGTAFADLGLEPFTVTQTIRSPFEVEYARFGSSLAIDQSSINLVVGAKHGNARLYADFDQTLETEFDSDSTKFVDEKVESGAVYTFDLLPSATPGVAGNFVFGQQIVDSSISELDQFGWAVSYLDGTLVVASPHYDTAVNNIGRVTTFHNADNQSAWRKTQEQPLVVDSRKETRCYIYNKNTQDVITKLDFIDPINGKLLGVVKENLDFITQHDPASYDSDKGVLWTNSHVGKIWWDVSNTRYLNYNQENIVYSSKKWATLVDGSTVDVYEWIESNVPPAQYAGTVYDINSYSTLTGINAQRTIVTKYYFWAKTSGVNTEAGKSLSANTIAEYIENPLASGIPFIALMRSNKVALFNVSDLLLDNKTSVLHIEYSKTHNDRNVFVEYDLIKAGDPNAFMSDQIWRKMKDSLCGFDTLGNMVPDFNLSPTNKYGVDFRPRQSMFKDRFTALDTFIGAANTLLLTHPFAELRTFNLLNDQEALPEANTGAWNSKVSDLTELSYQDTSVDGVGYKYLVEVDENNNGYWTIYTVQSDQSLLLTRVQSYDTANYWEYANWYATGFSTLTKPSKIVKTYSELLALTSEADKAIVKVETNSDNKWELYSYSTATTQWTRIALQDGTIQIKSSLWDNQVSNNGFDTEVFDVKYFDEQPTIELRNILEALAFEILVGDFLLFRNALMITAFDYILYEQGKVDWIHKTSLIDVNHKVRNLDQYPVYRKDNQDFVLDYIQESKPYHVQIKEFLTRYDGIDTVNGNVYDYDVPSAYDSVNQQFVSPVLEDAYSILETDASNRPTTDSVWQTRPWSDWYSHHKLDIDRIVITNGGENYTVAPQVVFSGEADTQATGTATINEDGEVSGITLTSTGSGYRTVPTITISGGNGTGATAVAYTKSNLVRSNNLTIKYDRLDYSTSIVDWEPNTVYDTNDLVRYNNRVYKAVNADGSTPSDATFDPGEYTLVEISELTGLDRTRGYYVGSVNKPGLDLALLINGLDYPMIQLEGPGFEYNTGYDVGNYDLTVFDNIEYDESGVPTYSESILDNEIFTSFTGSYPGVDLSGIESVQATATSTVAGYAVTSIIANDIGKGYSADIPPTVVLSEPRDNLTAAANANTNGDQITSVTLTAPGFGYTSAPTVTITEQAPTSGVTATATAEELAGQITGAIITLAGSGYVSAPTVVFADPPSVATARATATADTLNTTGGVTGTTITNVGSAYTTPPAVTVSAPPASVTATGTIALTASTYRVETTGTVTESGNYYSVAPTVTVEAPTATEVQATASASISSNQVASISVDNPGHMYQTAPTVTIVPATPTSGVNAAATATLDPDISGFDSDDGFDATALDAEGGVGTITVTVPGSGYTVAPTVTISAPDLSGGTQATATATVSGDTAPLYNGDGYVVTITVTEPGTGYTSAPTVSISAPDTVINHGVGATATATISDTDVISITVTNPGNHYDIAPTVTIAAPTTPYTATVTATVANGIVTGLTATDQGWGYETAPALTIAAPDVTPVTAQFTAVLTGDAVTSLTIDTAGAGYLTVPTLEIAADPAIANDIATGTATLSDDGVASITITNPGANYVSAPVVTISAPTGLTYHGSGATATAAINAATSVVSITVTNPGSGYDIAPDVSITAPTRLTRRATAEPVVVGGGVTSYKILDPGLGYVSAPTVTVGEPSDIDPDADIAGGNFVDVHNSHAPEELVPGAIFDTLDLKVFTRPGYDYALNGHGFEVKSRISKYVAPGNDISWDNLVDYPVDVVVFNTDTGVHLYETHNYTVDWANKTIDVTSGATAGQFIKVFVYALGGSNQLLNKGLIGSDIDTQLTIDVNYTDIETMFIQVNGEEISSYTYNEGLYPSQTVITFSSSYTANDYIGVSVLGSNPAEDGSTVTNLGISHPHTQVFVCDGSTETFTIDADISHASHANLIVEHNGLRLRPAAGKRHVGDASTGTYELPDGDRTGIDLGDVDADEVEVYVNMVRQTDGVDYQLDPADGSSVRTITFLTNFPDNDEVIDVYVTKTAGNVVEGIEQGKIARYFIGEVDSSQQLTIVTGSGLSLVAGDTIAVTSFNDIREQDISTQVFVGPIVVSSATYSLFDQTRWDQSAPYPEVLFDEVSGIETVTNVFELDRVVVNTDRMWVTLNGQRLVPGVDYAISLDGLLLTLAGGSIHTTDVVAVTMVTESVVPHTLGFRIFKDMRDNVAVYRMREQESTTTLTRELKWTDDEIHVLDASKLGEPNLDAAVFGIITINGERITYRNRNTTTNTVSGLRRSTGGTGMNRVVAAGTVVRDMGRGEMYDPVYTTTRWKKDTAYNAGDIVKYGNSYYRAKTNVPATEIINDNDYSYPTAPGFDNTYWDLYETTWYAQGATTATDGTALQQQRTLAARFFRGE